MCSIPIYSGSKHTFPKPLAQLSACSLGLSWVERIKGGETMAKRPENFVTDLSDILIRRRVILPEEAKVYQAQYEASDLDSFEDFLLDQGRVSKEEILEA